MTTEDERVFNEIAYSLFPITPRRDGAIFDAFIGNPYVNDCRLENITTPTLIVHSTDDALAPYGSAQNAAVRMPSARFVTIDKGGHEFLGHQSLVPDAIHESLKSIRKQQPAGV
jgi:pimeloyl-ACP methyl ester carboxylesterase